MTVDHEFKTGDRVLHADRECTYFGPDQWDENDAVVGDIDHLGVRRYWPAAYDDLTPLPEWTVTISHRGEVVGSFDLPDEEVQSVWPFKPPEAFKVHGRAYARFRAALVEAREAVKP